jgi:hypothetical protein
MVRETGRFTRASTKPRVGLTRVTRRFARGRASCSCVSRGPICSAAETMADNGSAAELNGMIGTPHARQVLVAEPRRGQPTLLDILGPWAFDAVAGLFALGLVLGRTPGQAVILIHGIGEQTPGSTIRSFVEGVLHGKRYLSKPTGSLQHPSYDGCRRGLTRDWTTPHRLLRVLLGPSASGHLEDPGRDVVVDPQERHRQRIPSSGRDRRT